MKNSMNRDSDQGRFAVFGVSAEADEAAKLFEHHKARVFFFFYY